jgi:hypothetical protein
MRPYLFPSVKISAGKVYAAFLMYLAAGCFSLLDAQQVPLPDRRITIHADNRRLGDVLREIETKAGFVFSYSSGLIDESKQVSVHAVNRPVREILDKILGSRIQYRVRGRHLILTYAATGSGDTRVIGGYIEDASGKGIGRTTVYDPVSLVSANTNDQGYYELKIDPLNPPLNLEVRRPDLQDTVILVHASGATLQPMVPRPRSVLAPRWDAARDTVRTHLSKAADRLFGRQPESQNVGDTLYRDFQVSLLPYIGSNRKMSGQVINRYSVNVIGGYARGSRVLEVGGVFNAVRDHVSGAQVAGVLNLVGGNAEGVQVAGVANLTGGESRGAMISGFASYIGGEAEVVSVSGALSVFREHAEGVSVAGFSSVAMKSFEGVQVNGAAGIALAEFSGVQISGFANMVTGNADAVQIAGVVNFCTGEFKGAQVSGLLNVARRVEGVQVGVFNICDTITGVPVGFMSFVRRGYHPLEFAYSDIGMAEVSFRTGVRSFYTFLSAGIAPPDRGGVHAWQYGFGAGTSPRISDDWFINLDISAHHLSEGKFAEFLSLDNRLRCTAEWKATPWLSLFGGPVYHLYLDHTNTPDIRDRVGIPQHRTTEDTRRTLRLTSWPGWQAGVRVGLRSA